MAITSLRTLFTFAIVIISAPCLAQDRCPELDGQYKCIDKANRERIVRFKSYLNGGWFSKTPFYKAQIDSLKEKIYPDKTQYVTGLALGFCIPTMIQYFQAKCYEKAGVPYLRVASYPAVNDEEGSLGFSFDFRRAEDGGIYFTDLSASQKVSRKCTRTDQ